MKKPKLCSFILCSALLVALLTGCGSRTEVAQSPSQQEIETFRSPIAREEDELIYEATQLLAAGDFNTIENRLARYRRNRETFLDGKEKLILFYQGLGWAADDEKQWQKQQQQLEAWIKEKPQSISAPIALAFSYCQGNVFARRALKNSATPEVQERLAQSRLKLARETLEKVRASRKLCPGWFNTASMVYSLRKEDRDTFNQYLEEGQQLFSQWNSLHFNPITTLLVLANEEGGAWKLYLTNAANKAGGKDGDLLMARMIWLAVRGQVPAWDQALKTEYDWPRAKRGFEQLMDNPGLETDSVVGAYAKAAWLQKDRQTARPLFERYIKNSADRSVWVGPEEFTDARNWALE